MTAPNHDDLLALLREAFDRSGLTQAQLADRLGVHPGEVSRRLHNPSDLRWSTLTRTLAAMGTSLTLAAALSAVPDDEAEAEGEDPTLLAAATAWVEATTSHPNNWAGDEEAEIIRTVRRLVPDVTCQWLTNPQYEGWADLTAPRPAPVPAAPAEPAERDEGEILHAIREVVASSRRSTMARDLRRIAALAARPAPVTANTTYPCKVQLAGSGTCSWPTCECGDA